MNGRGKLTWPDGRKYEGNFEDDKRHGVGTYWWKDGRVYRGMWEKGQQHGKGYIRNKPNQEEKKGLWEHGKRVQWLDK